MMKRLLFLLLSVSCLQTGYGQPSPSLIWLSDGDESPDVHAGFRGSFHLEEPGEIEFRLCGSSPYIVWLDGEYYTEGPDRYTAEHPEYQVRRKTLRAGNHLIAVQVHHEGIDTRIMKNIPPFLYAEVERNGENIPIAWKCTRLPGYDSGNFRISGLYGWVEWLDTRALPEGWNKPGFDDSQWIAPTLVERNLGELKPSRIGEVKALPVDAKPLAEGPLAEVYGYERDNPSARFFLRDLECKNLRPQGIWRRYDLGRVRLVRPTFELDLPPGAVVEIAYSEALHHGRVSPWISLSLSDSYHLDHFVARGGIQQFTPFGFKGGRFVEIHVLAPGQEIRFLSERFAERTYYGEPQGSFHCNDTLLNRIWQTGVNTYRACSEDALTDTPVRERGQWLGDVGIGMQTGTSAWSDIRICRRALVQFAQCAGPDGMVAGLCPGPENYLSTYAAQWVAACLDYWRLTGDRTILEELYPAARANAVAFEKYMTEDGISPAAGWGFIDWGYVPNEGPCDMGVNAHVYRAFRDMTVWCEAVGRKEDAARYASTAGRLREILDKYYRMHLHSDGYDWEAIGYHRTVLGISLGFIGGEAVPEAVAFIKKHILSCFPNDPQAPVLSDPGANNPRLITPYFAHQAFPVLIEAGEMDFVLGQYRTCWGWMLEQGLTTWAEVFDIRWSHCHQWSGCPTWQLSRYGLGLHPRFDRGENYFLFDLQSGDLEKAEGMIPLPGGERVSVAWEKRQGKIYYEITVSEPVTIEIPASANASRKGRVRIKDRMEMVIG